MTRATEPIFSQLLTGRDICCRAREITTANPSVEFAHQPKSQGDDRMKVRARFLSRLGQLQF